MTIHAPKISKMKYVQLYKSSIGGYQIEFKSIETKTDKEGFSKIQDFSEQSNLHNKKPQNV